MLNQYTTVRATNQDAVATLLLKKKKVHIIATHITCQSITNSGFTCS